MLGMIRAADRAGAEWSLLYTGRHRAALPFLDEIACYGNRVTVRTDDEAGLPTAAVLVPSVEPGLAVYVCGPPALLEVVAARVARAPGVELHHERFAPPPIVDGRAFSVQWGRRGRVFEVPVEHRDTVLNDAQRAQGDMLICVSRARPGELLVLDANTGAAGPVPPPHRGRYRVRLARAMPKRMRLGGVKRVP